MSNLKNDPEVEDLKAFRASQASSPMGERIREFYDAQEILPPQTPGATEKQPSLSHLYEIDVSSVDDIDARACIERMQKALQNIILWNQEHAKHECGDPDKAENLACIRECRDSLKTVQSLLKQKQQSN